MKKYVKFQVLDFLFENEEEEKQAEIVLDKNFNTIEKITFASTSSYPVITSIMNLDIDGDSSIFPRGLQTGHFATLGTGEPNGINMDYELLENSNEKKVIATLKDVLEDNRTYPYTIQMCFHLKNK